MLQILWIIWDDISSINIYILVIYIYIDGSILNKIYIYILLIISIEFSTSMKVENIYSKILFTKKYFDIMNKNRYIYNTIHSIEWNQMKFIQYWM